MIVYGSSLSPFVRKVIAYAAEKGMEIELKPTALGEPDPDFRAASPFGKMPAFSDGDYRLSNSSAIIHYLEAKYPEPNLIPAEPKARGRTIWFDEFADTILFACGGKMFFNRIVAPRFLGREGDLALGRRGRARRIAADPRLSGEPIPASGYLVEDRLTLADIAVASPFANLRHSGSPSTPRRYPKVSGLCRARSCRGRASRLGSRARRLSSNARPPDAKTPRPLRGRGDFRL